MAIDLHLTKAQLNKLKKDAPFQMSKSQIEKGGCGLTTHCKVELDPKQLNKLLRNLKSGKGFRFQSHHITGSGWWDSLKSGFQTVKGHLENAGHFIKDNIDEGTAKQILNTAVNVGTKLAGKEHLADKINSGVDKGVSYGYSSKKKSLKDHAKDLSQVYEPELNEAKDVIKEKAMEKFNEKFGKKDEQPAEGNGLKFPKKGSQEARDKMARLRAMRKKKKSGEGFWGDLASGLIHTGIPAVASALGGVAGEMMGGPVGAAMGGVGGNEVGNMAANAIGKSTGYGLQGPQKIIAPYMGVIGGIPVPMRKIQRTNKGGQVKHGGSFLQL